MTDFENLVMKKKNLMPKFIKNGRTGVIKINIEL